MKIQFEWYAKTLSREEEVDIEAEITQKITHHIDKSINMPIKELKVNLFDEQIGYQVTGSAFTIKDDEKIEVIKEIKINPGFHMEFATI